MKSRFLFFFLFFFSFQSWAGNDGGNAGDTYAREFHLLGIEIHKSLLMHPEHRALKRWSLSPERFIFAIHNTQVRSAEGENVILNNYEVDAINYPLGGEPILVNRTRWRNKNLIEKLDLVMHEYLGVLGIELGGYTASSEFSDILLKTYDRIRAQKKLLEIDLYYGYQRLYTKLTSSLVCDERSEAFKASLMLTQADAMSKCLTFKEKCRLTQSYWRPVVSVQYVGSRYCEIEAIAN